MNIFRIWKKRAISIQSMSVLSDAFHWFSSIDLIDLFDLVFDFIFLCIFSEQSTKHKDNNQIRWLLNSNQNAFSGDFFYLNWVNAACLLVFFKWNELMKLKVQVFPLMVQRLHLKTLISWLIHFSSKEREWIIKRSKQKRPFKRG